ncbi:MAG: rhomboid family intramembrane serine protease [Bacteroidales bacterium]|nr:rhomboid family intramembrane serine protease [Bacteroidales bacterium]MBQ6742767.1 rhomboid family intramembrane serine protease [Bacteroidales bacterium]
MLPTGVKHLLIINVLMFAATYVLERLGYLQITNMLCLWPLGSGLFRIWQPLSYMFMHAGLDHIFFNMFALWMFGYVLENYWGTKRFVAYYLVCGIGAAITHMAMSLLFKMPLVPTVGASGAVYGILLAFGMMFPNERIYLYFLMPIKAKWFVIGYAAIELFEGFFRADNVAHFAHLGGMLFGLILILLWRRRNRNDNPYQMY